MVLMTCKRCGLNDSMCGVNIIGSEQCNLCSEYDASFSEGTGTSVEDERLELRGRFEKRIEEAKNEGATYDCALSLSGGKDSSYLLFLLKNEYKMRVLALGILHPFAPAGARQNMAQVAENVGVDLMMFQPDENRFKRYFKRGLELAPSYFDENFGCLLCSSHYNGLVIRIAAKLGIPLVMTGRAPHQNGVPWREGEELRTRMNQSREFWDAQPETIVDTLSDDTPEGLSNLWDAPKGRIPTVIDPYRFIDYSHSQVVDQLERLRTASRNEMAVHNTNCVVKHFFSYWSNKWWNCIPIQRGVAHLLRTDNLDVESFYNEEGRCLKREEIVPFYDDYRRLVSFIAAHRSVESDELEAFKSEVPVLSGFYGETEFMRMCDEVKEIHKYAEYFEVKIR